MTTTYDSMSAISVNWTSPSDIVTQGATLWNRIRVYRSQSESTGYQFVQDSDGSTAAPVTFTTGTNLVMAAGHAYVNGNMVSFTTTGALPASLVQGTVYYVISAIAGVSFQVARSSSGTIGGAAIVFATAGTGTHSVLTGTLKSEILSQIIAGTWVTSWDDTTQPMASKDAYYYLVRYYDTNNDIESKFYLTWKLPTPKEARLIQYIRTFMTPWIAQFMTDDDIRGGIILAMNYINIYPPTTSFTLESFPTAYEPVLVMGAAIWTLAFKYLNIAITDFNYSDMGFSLNIDRGAKVKEALNQLLAMYNSTLPLMKMEFSFGGSSLAELPLPVGIGGKLSGSLMNIFDLFNAVGR